MFNYDKSTIEERMTKTRPPGMSSSEKVRTWNAIEQELAVRKVGFSYVRYWKHFQSRIVAVTLGLLILLGGGTTAFARSAMPGDALFPVVIATERAQILFAGEKDKETLRIKFAEKRLAQVRTVTMETRVLTASSAPIATSHSTSDAKKLARAEHARAIAEGELMATRNALLAKGNTDAVLIVDDIIAELRGVGNGSVVVTRFSGRGDDKVTFKATLSASSSATSTFSGSVTFEEKKNGTTMKIRSGETRAKIFVGEGKQGDDERVRDDSSSDDHEAGGSDDNDDRGGRDGDKEDEDGRDADDKGADRHHDERKITVCHQDKGGVRTISISTEGGRAHMAHGDTLGRCSAI